MHEDRPKVGVGVVIVKDGAVLLGQRLTSHGAGTWSLPGGHVEFGETFEETALREVKEETGLQDIQVQGLVCVSNDVVYDKHFVTVGMEAALVSGEPQVMEPEKSANWTWFHRDELPEDIFLPSKYVLQSWKAKTIYRNSIDS